MTITTATHVRIIDGLNGSFEHSCVIECEQDPACGDVIIAGTDSQQQAWAMSLRCVEDMMTNPQVYEDSGLVLHGTHVLDDDLLAELFGPGRGMPTDTTFYTDLETNGYTLADLGETDDTGFVAVAHHRESGDVDVLSAQMLHDFARNPEKVTEAGLKLYGTHVLPEAILVALFAEDGE